MNNLKTRDFNQMIHRVICFCMSVVLAIGIAFINSNAAQAARDTTSAATRADANQINQRKENAPHYPNWYDDQRGLESYMDKTGVNPRRQGDSPTDQNNDRGYNPIRQDRVNGYNSQDRDQSGNLIERSRDRLQDAADNIRGTLGSDSTSRRDIDYDRSSATTENIKDRAGNRLEQAKEVFQEATERAGESNNPIITGESNR